MNNNGNTCVRRGRAAVGAPAALPAPQVHPGVSRTPVRHIGLPPFLTRTRRAARAARPAKGFSSVLATFYVTLFSGLAISYTAMTGLNSQSAGNARSEQFAQAAAESGVSIMRYYITALTATGGTTSDVVFTQLGTLLANTFNGTLNLNGRTVTATTTLIYVPPIKVDVNLPNATFETSITRVGATYTVQVTGHYTNVARKVQVTFTELLGPPQNSIMQNGIVSRGSITFNGSAKLTTNAAGGSGIMALDPTANPPIHLNGSGQFQSDLFMAKSGVTASQVFNGSAAWGPAGGTTFTDTNAAAHVHSGITPPSFPTVDTSAFDALNATLPHTTITSSTNTTGTQTYHNLYIAANANPRFTGGVTVTGMVYVAWPNNVIFNGSLALTGLIVCQPPPYEPSIYMNPNCAMTFNGSVNSTGPENLPNTSEYTGLRSQTGTFLLAKDYAVLFNGSTGTMNGSIYTSTLRFNGTVTGTVRGSILADRQEVLQENGSVNLNFIVDPASQLPSGLNFTQNKSLAYQAGSYQEL